MDSLLRPDIFSGSLQVKGIKDVETLDNGIQKAEVELWAPVSDDFIDFYNGCEDKVLNTRVNLAVLGMQLNADVDNAEFMRRGRSPRGQMTLKGEITRLKEGIEIAPLSVDLIPVDSLVGRIILTDFDKKIKGDELRRVISEIIDNYPAMKNVLDPEKSEFSFDNVKYFAKLRNEDITSDDLRRFLFGLRVPGNLNAIVDRLKVDTEVNMKGKEGESLIFVIDGFTHPDALGIFGKSENSEIVGSKAVFPRCNFDAYEKMFLTRLNFLKTLFLKDIKLPISFYPTKRRKIGLFSGGTSESVCFEKIVEPYAKLDMEIMPSFPATQIIFEVLGKSVGSRKAVFVKDEKGFNDIAKGDQAQVKHYEPYKQESAVNILFLAENPDLSPTMKVDDPSSFAEMQILDEVEQGQHGILFTQYFPNTHVLKRIEPQANKLRAIVFEFASFHEEEKGIDVIDKLFFNAEEMVSLRDFHKRYPTIKIVWSHPESKRNLIFVDDGKKLPMFAKPEVARYLENLDESVRVSFCGSSSAKPNMKDEEKKKYWDEEKAFTQMYNDYANFKKKKLVGINGGGPDVMERNGKDLQECKAISISSACDLRKAKQSRHGNWDAVLNSAGDATSLQVREEYLVGGDIVHIAKGGLGSIKEILDPLVTNKLKFGEKKIIAVGRKYWAPIVKQFIDASKEGNIKAENMNLLFVVDTPEEARRIFDNFDQDPEYIKARTAVWQKIINGEINQEELFKY